MKNLKGTAKRRGTKRVEKKITPKRPQHHIGGIGDKPGFLTTFCNTSSGIGDKMLKNYHSLRGLQTKNTSVLPYTTMSPTHPINQDKMQDML